MDLKDKVKHIEDIQSQVTYMKKYASNFQTFIGIKIVEDMKETLRMRYKTLFDDGQLNTIKISMTEANETIFRFRPFDDIKVEICPTAISDVNSSKKSNVNQQISSYEISSDVENISKKSSLSTSITCVDSDFLTECCNDEASNNKETGTLFFKNAKSRLLQKLGIINAPEQVLIPFRFRINFEKKFYIHKGHLTGCCLLPGGQMVGTNYDMYTLTLYDSRANIN